MKSGPQHNYLCTITQESAVSFHSPHLKGFNEGPEQRPNALSPRQELHQPHHAEQPKERDWDPGVIFSVLEALFQHDKHTHMHVHGEAHTLIYTVHPTICTPLRTIQGDTHTIKLICLQQHVKHFHQEQTRDTEDVWWLYETMTIF